MLFDFCVESFTFFIFPGQGAGAPPEASGAYAPDGALGRGSAQDPVFAERSAAKMASNP